MKENLKTYLFYISIFYSITILILMLINITTSISSIELFDSEENKNKLTELKKEVMNLKQNDCKKEINNLINYYESTSYNGKINLKDMYNFDTSLLSFYGTIKNNCNVTEQDIEKYNLPTKFLTSSIQVDEILQNYYFQYELSFKDIFLRTIIEPSITNIEYKISKNLQLEIIEILIDLENKEDIENE